MWVVEKYVKYLIGFAILWFGLIFYRSCGCAKVQGNYMAPSYISDQFVTVLAGKNKPGAIEVKDIVWFWYKVPTSKEEGYLARVVGLPGDRVAIKNGDILIKGVLLPEEYLRAEVMAKGQNIPEIVVPRDTYFILCDNRRDPQAPDSRRFGPIPINAVWGKIRK
ncbi:MAG: signal peptidase I [Planctomycetes bacterium]|nr:signal peptidase I [Planctomycetota bacterium]